MQEEMRLITFDPLWETMKNRSITLTTLNDICSILGCSVEDVILYIPDEK